MNGAPFPSTTYPPTNLPYGQINPMINSQPQQSRESITFTSSKYNEEQSWSNSSMRNIQNNPSTIPKSSANISSTIYDNPSRSSQESEAPDDQISPADISLTNKMTRTKLFEPDKVIVDRSDPSSPLYSLKSFEEMNLKPDLLKGKFLINFNRKNSIYNL